MVKHVDASPQWHQVYNVTALSSPVPGFSLHLENGAPEINLLTASLKVLCNAKTRSAAVGLDYFYSQTTLIWDGVGDISSFALDIIINP